MERREFLKGALLLSVGGVVKAKEGSLFAAAPKEIGKNNDLVAVMGGEPQELYSKAIELMGGLSKYIKRGYRVVVKPNIGWDKTPEYGANTNPQLVEAIVRDCFRVGASQVTVFDHTCDEWRACYKNSGIEEAAKRGGAKIAFAHDEKYYRTVQLPKALSMKQVKIHEAIVECDAWINVPVLKNHGGAKMTISMKNFMGIVWDRRFMHANNLQQSIADCSTYEKMPVLNIVDAYRIMVKNGPKGRTVEDVETPKALFISTNVVSADTAAIKFFSQFVPVELDDVHHIALAEKMGIGSTNLDQLKIERVKLG
ncbi:MAG: DUF362 domain-containing protein [Bacteroidales bacterium]